MTLDDKILYFDDYELYEEPSRILIKHSNNALSFFSQLKHIIIIEGLLSFMMLFNLANENFKFSKLLIAIILLILLVPIVRYFLMARFRILIKRNYIEIEKGINKKKIHGLLGVKIERHESTYVNYSNAATPVYFNDLVAVFQNEEYRTLLFTIDQIAESKNLKDLEIVCDKINKFLQFD